MLNNNMESRDIMKKGFTLIELLAVIVLLAVFSVIAYATVRGVIEKSRRTSALNSAYGYMDSLEKQVAINQIYAVNEINDGIYKSIDELKDTYKVKVKGSYPKMGIIQIEKGKVKHADFIIDKYYLECFSSTNCKIKDGKTKIKAIEVEINGIDGIENVQEALDDLREKLS